MLSINEVITRLLDAGNKPKDLAINLSVSEALISTWKNKDNDFVPRLNIAKKIFSQYGMVVYPYAQEALDDT